MQKEHYPFTLQDLPYSYSSMEPHIDERTMEIHHLKHQGAYVDKLNKTLEDAPKYQNWSLEKLLTNLYLMPKNLQQSIRQNGGGVYNHNLFFGSLSPVRYVAPSGGLGLAIDNTFGSYQNFLGKMKTMALNQFGSGWVWLLCDRRGNLRLLTTPNQDTPLNTGLTPILIGDVWEHAYYLKYQNRRGEYLDNWIEVIDWQKCEDRFLKATHSQVDSVQKV